MLFEFLKYIRPVWYFNRNQLNGNTVFPNPELLPEEIKEQVTLANSLSTRGYEFVIGSGPHEVHKTKLTENSLVSYSLGDFLSEHMDKKAKDQGVILSIEISESKVIGVTLYNTKSHGEDGDTKIVVQNREVLL